MHSYYRLNKFILNSVKVKQSRYKPGVAQRVPGSQRSQITRQRHRMAVRLSALRILNSVAKHYNKYSHLQHILLLKRDSQLV